MLRETSHVAQVKGDYPRRCFIDEALDLTMWYNDDQTVHGFQLCYDHAGSSRAVTWTPQRGFIHAMLDLGEDDPLANRSPVLQPCGDFNATQLLGEFLAASVELPVKERAFVTARLKAAASAT